MKFYHNFVIYILFPLVDLIVGTSFYKNYKLLKYFEKLTRDELLDYQLVKLRELLIYSYKNVPYYNEAFSKSSIKKFDDFLIDDLYKIPILTKEIISKNHKLLKSRDFNFIRKKKHQSGGTTGTPVSFYQDLTSYSFSWPANIRAWEKIGYRIGDKIMVLGSSSLYQTKKKLKNKLLHKILRIQTFGGINMSQEVCRKYIDAIEKNKIRFIYGYASSIFILAKYVYENEIEIKIKGIMPTSEMCPSHYKEMYKKAFKCRICDSYGARDGNIAAFECPEGNFHLNEYSIVITKNRDLSGSILVTDLFNKSMPIINYEVGDVMEFSSDKCLCGSNKIIVKQLLGRKENVMEFGNGRAITGPGWTILFKDKNIDKYQIKKINNFQLQVKLVPNNLFTSKEKENIYFSIKKEVGDEVEVQLKLVKDFPVSLNGKATYFMN